MTYWQTKKRKDGTLEWVEYPRFDVDTEIRKLIPEKLGRDYALASNTDQDPPEGHLTAIERNLLKTVNEHISGLQSWHNRIAGDMNAKINETWEQIYTDKSLKAISNDFKIDAHRHFNDFKNEKQKLLQNHDLATRELNSFKQKNKLRDRHQAYYAESNTLYFAILFVALVIEGGANAYFFPNDMGLLGGFVTAFGISLANIVFCFLVGWGFLRWINYDISNHEHRSKHLFFRILSAIGFLISLVLIFGLHCSVAQYRENAQKYLEISSALDATIIMESLSFDPRGLQDMESLVLILIGTAISILACYKGYNFDDPYPGFGKVYRKWKELDDLVSDINKEKNSKLLVDYKNAVSKVDEFLDKPNVLEKELKILESDIQTQLACAKSYHEQARQGGFALLTIFRNTVQEIRNDLSCLPVNQNLIEDLNQLDPEEMEKNVLENLQLKLNKLEEIREKYFKTKDSVIQELSETLDKWTNEDVTQIGSGLKVEIEENEFA